LEAYIGKEITPVNVVGLMFSSKEYWERIEATVIKILKTREEVEREKEKKVEEPDERLTKLS